MENQVYRIVEDQGVSYLEFKILDPYKDYIRHGITLRYGGVSPSPYDSLNFRLGGKDSKENVMENVKRICDRLHIPKEQLYKARQAHTDHVLVIHSKNKEKYAYGVFNEELADGYIVKEKGIATMVTTADCNPIILYDPVTQVVANIHSGWKGTIKQIYLKAIELLKQEFSVQPENLIVCIGPSIRKCCFSSEEESFKEKFTQVFENPEKYITYEKENQKRFHIDLIYVITQDLLNVGVKRENIAVADICTRCHHDEFFSYRYALQNHEKDYGLMATIVGLLPF